jgi:hypothetical protein
LKDWFKNRTRAGTAGGEGKTKIFEFAPKKSRKLPLYQAYSKLYYESKLKETIQQRWSNKYHSENPHHTGGIPPPSMDFRNAETKALLDEESEEVQEEVRKKQDTMDFGAGPDDEGEEQSAAISPEQRERERKAVEFQKYNTRLVPSRISTHEPSDSGIDTLNRIMVSVLDEVHQKTGLIGMAMFAGPEPRQGGSICLVECVLLVLLHLALALMFRMFSGTTKASLVKENYSMSHTRISMHTSANLSRISRRTIFMSRNRSFSLASSPFTNSCVQTPDVCHSRN